MMLNIGARLNALGAMTACGLAPGLAKKHAIEQLTACCEAIKASGVDGSRFQNCDAKAVSGEDSRRQNTGDSAPDDCDVVADLLNLFSHLKTSHSFFIDELIIPRREKIARGFSGKEPGGRCTNRILWLYSQSR